MCFQIGCIDHDGLWLCHPGREALHYPGKDLHPAPTLPAVVKRLGRPIFTRCIAPPQPVAIDKDYATENSTVIHSRTPVPLGEERPKPVQLRFRQPEQIAYLSSLLPEAHESWIKSMGPDRNTHRSLTRGLPWLLGKKGCSRIICACMHESCDKWKINGSKP